MNIHQGEVWQHKMVIIIITKINNNSKLNSQQTEIEQGYMNNTKFQQTSTLKHFKSIHTFVQDNVLILVFQFLISTSKFAFYISFFV